MLEDCFREAVLPSFEAGHVDMLEYSFELGWARPMPAWAQALLQHYGHAGRLWGHGVTYSPGSTDDEGRQQAWLARVRKDCASLTLQGVSEHYGFMGAGGLDVGAPLPLPPDDAVVDVTVAALRRLGDATQARVGLENLALAMSPTDAATQAEHLTTILDAVDGDLVLDLHNLWTQAVNLGLEPVALMETYPLARVRVMHVSGGSWSEHGGVRWRRDTHDHRVPTEVFTLFEAASKRCPGAQAVVLEQLGPTLADPRAAAGFVEDFNTLRGMAR